MSRVLIGAVSAVMVVGSAVCGADETEASTDGAQLAPATEDPERDGQALDEIVVTGTRRQGYIVQVSDALGIPLETNKIPASVSILSDALLEFLNAPRVTDQVDDDLSIVIASRRPSTAPGP